MKEKKEASSYLREALEQNFPQYQEDKNAFGIAADALEEYERKGILGYEDIVEYFLHDGRLQYEGFQVRDAHSLALLLQTFRNVQFETFRMVYTKGDTIAAITGVESRLPHLSFTMPEKSISKGFYNMQRRMERLGADGFYMVHNHPTGDVLPSADDTNETMRFAQNLPGFRGHIILDHTKYSVLDENGVIGIYDIPEDYQNPLYYETETFLIGTKVRNADEVAAFFDHLNPAPERSLLVLTTAKGGVRTFEEVSNKVILHDKNFKNYIRNEMIRNGCTHAFLATQSEEIYDNCLPLVIDRYLMDAVYLDEIGMESANLWMHEHNVTRNKEIEWAGLHLEKMHRDKNNSGKMPTSLLREEISPYEFEQEVKSMNLTAEEFLEEMRVYFAGEKEAMSTDGLIFTDEIGADIELQVSDLKDCYWEIFEISQATLYRLSSGKEVARYDAVSYKYLDASGWHRSSEITDDIDAAIRMIEGLLYWGEASPMDGNRVEYMEGKPIPNIFNIREDYMHTDEYPSEKEIAKKHLEMLREADERNDIKMPSLSYSNDVDNVEVSMRLAETIKGCYWKTYDDGSGSLRRLQTDTVILGYNLHPVDSGYDEYEDARGWHGFERSEDFRLALENLVTAGIVSPMDHGAKDFALRSKEAKRLFLDMDGTLAEFHPVDTMETLYEQGYFAQLAPHENVVNGIKTFMNENPDAEVFILSSVLSDSPYAQAEKSEWLDRYLPEIGMENRIFVPCGSAKNEFVPGGVRENDVLLDDYSKNLHEWPGKALKLMNGINGTKGSFQGKKISAEMSAAEFAARLASFCEGEKIDDMNMENKNIENAELLQQFQSAATPKMQTVFQMMNGHLTSNPQAAVEKREYGMQDVCKAELLYPVSNTENKVIKLTATQDAAQALSKYNEGDIITFVGIPTNDGYKICRMDDGTVFAAQQKMLYDFTMRGEIPENDRKRELALSDIKEGFKNLSYEEKFKLVLEEEVDCHDNEDLKEELWESFRDNDSYLGFFGKDEVAELIKRRDRFLEIQADTEKDGGMEL